jgi:hypothetical protein
VSAPAGSSYDSPAASNEAVVEAAANDYEAPSNDVAAADSYGGPSSEAPQSQYGSGSGKQLLHNFEHNFD